MKIFEFAFCICTIGGCPPGTDSPDKHCQVQRGAFPTMAICQDVLGSNATLPGEGEKLVVLQECTGKPLADTGKAKTNER